MNNVKSRSSRVVRPSLSLDASSGDYHGPGRPVHSQTYQAQKSPGRPQFGFSGQTQSPQLSRPNFVAGFGAQPSSPQLAKQTMRLSISDSQDMSGRPMFYLGSGSPSPGRMPSTYENQASHRQYMNGPPLRDSPSPGNPRYGQYDGPLPPPRRLNLEQGQSPQSPRNSPSPGPRTVPQGSYSHSVAALRNSYDAANGTYPRDSPSPGPPPPPRQNSNPVFQSPFDGFGHRRSQPDGEIGSKAMASPSLVRSSSDSTNAHVSKPERPSLNFTSPGSSRDVPGMRATRPSLSMGTVQEGPGGSPAHHTNRSNLSFEIQSPPQRDCQSPSRLRESPSPSRPMRDCSSPGLSRPRQSPSPGPRSGFVVGPAFAVATDRPPSGDPPPTPPRRPSLNFTDMTNQPLQTVSIPDATTTSSGPQQHDSPAPRRPTLNFGPATAIPQSPSPGRPQPEGSEGIGASESPTPARRPNLNLGGPPGSSSPRTGRAGRPTLQIGEHSYTTLHHLVLLVQVVPLLFSILHNAQE